MNNAPPGADYDVRAPWFDREEPEEREYDKYEEMERDAEQEEYDYENQL
jgi:hypothetical protein